MIPGLFSEFSFLSIAEHISSYRRTSGTSRDKPIVAIINRAIEKNQFAHTNHDERFAVISLSSIEELLEGVSKFEYMSFEVAQHAVAIVYKAFTHREPRGCFFDFCGDKRDALNIFKNGSFCSACKKALPDKSRNYLVDVWSTLERKKKEADMAVDPNLITMVLGSISALAGLISATESSVNLSKEARLRKLQATESEQEPEVPSSYIGTISEMADDSEEQEIILERIRGAQDNLKEALRNGTREQEAQAIDLAGSEICRALSVLKRLNHGVLPTELYPLWTKFRC